MRKTPYTKADYISSKKVVAYMTENVTDHVDPLTGEVNATGLAEDACDHFDGYEGNEIPQKFFDVAAIVAARVEMKTGAMDRNQPNLNWLSSMVNQMNADWF